MPRALRRGRWALLMAVVTALLWPAWAMADEDGYRRHMDVGIKLFEDENYEAAVVEFDAAYREMPKASPLINKALCYKATFQYAKAIDELSRALDEHLDTVEKPDAVRAAIAELEELVSTVRISVEPADVSIRRVTLDGEPLAGDSIDAPLRVGPGTHRITVEADGYAEATQTFSIASGTRDHEITVRLTAEQGRLSITAPKGVAVLVDRRNVGDGGWEGWMSPGTHLVELVVAGSDARYTATIAIAAGSRETITLRPDGMMVIGGQPPVGPDGTEGDGEPPTISGFYGLGEFAVYGLASEEVGNFGYAGGARLGYRVSRIFGAELMFQQGFAGETNADLRSTRVGANIRVMTSPDVVRFVMTSGLGLAYDDLETVASDTDGAGVYLLLEPGLEVDLDGLIFGFGTGLLATVSDTEIALVKGQFSTALHVGYGFW